MIGKLIKLIFKNIAVILPTKEKSDLTLNDESSNQGSGGGSRWIVNQSSDAALTTIASLNTSLSSPVIVPLDGKFCSVKLFEVHLKDWIFRSGVSYIFIQTTSRTYLSKQARVIPKVMELPINMDLQDHSKWDTARRENGKSKD